MTGIIIFYTLRNRNQESTPGLLKRTASYFSGKLKELKPKRDMGILEPLMQRNEVEERIAKLEREITYIEVEGVPKESKEGYAEYISKIKELENQRGIHLLLSGVSDTLRVVLAPRKDFY